MIPSLIPASQAAAGRSGAGARARVDGKFFRLGTEKFYPKGVTYGPFAPNAVGEMFPPPERTAADFNIIGELGGNLIRVYYVPPPWLLDLADEHGLKVLIDIPWTKHLCFLDSRDLQRQARKTVRDAVESVTGHCAVFAWSMANEIPAEIVRWSGAGKVAAFLGELIEEAKSVDPGSLCTFASFPSTEFLQAENADFACFNVYLHQRPNFESYLARLQMLAGEKPLMLGELGIDSMREGEAAKCEILSWKIEAAFRAGLAGTVVFSFTDDWFRGGFQIDDWAFGLTTRERQLKDSFFAVQRIYPAAPHLPLPRSPKVSVVVAAYNGSKTLKTCLDSLLKLQYPDYEIILVDDGSTDNTPEIAQCFPSVRYIRQANKGLSAARNAGIAAAEGEIVAFTDSDCRADEDWLYYLVGDLLGGDFAAVGGHNFLPADDSPVAAAVMASPGGPAHVMLDDREAEHIPGCNMAFYKWALEEIGGFDPVFRKAGDDVDVCWRLREQGRKIGFSAAGFVWHYRRSTARAYLHQQAGYGEAEALLARKHPEYFSLLGGSIWRGRIYTASNCGLITQRPMIYRGVFGSSLFQKLYAPQPAPAAMLFTSLEYYAAVVLPLLPAASWVSALWPLTLTAALIPLGICGVAAAQARLPKSRRRFWSRPLVGLLFFLQPLVRGWARYRARWSVESRPAGERLRTAPAREIWAAPDTVVFWSRRSIGRYEFLNKTAQALEAQNWQVKLDSGWTDFDAEIAGNSWNRLRLTTVSEELDGGEQNLRVRLQSNWSLPAKALFWGLAGAQFLLIALLAELQPWVWMVLPVLPLVLWFVEYERLRLQSGIFAIVESLATGQELVRLDKPSLQGQSGQKK